MTTGRAPVVVRDTDTLRAALDAACAEASSRAGGVPPRIGFVPTMGALHAGHAALVREARATCDVVVASVFVNPAQFDDPADLARYPRDEAGDLATLGAAGCDVAFLPTPDVLYPDGFASWVDVAGPALPLEGAHRPGHFRGVATVVTLLLRLVRPHVAFFGEKDWQQLAVVRRVVADLRLDVAIVGVPTVREPDGLALSSRNVRLDDVARRAATVVPRALAAAQRAWQAGAHAVGELERAMAATLAGEPAVRVEYAVLVHADTLTPPASGTFDAPGTLATRGVGETGHIAVGPAARALVAVRLGDVRLIDNAPLDGAPVA